LYIDLITILLLQGSISPWTSFHF